MVVTRFYGGENIGKARSGQAGIARHVIHCILSPRLLSYMASYDVAK